MPGFISRQVVRCASTEFVSIGIQRNPAFIAQFGPTAGGRKGGEEPPPGQPDLLDANQPCWPFRRCLMKKSCSMKRSFYDK